MDFNKCKLFCDSVYALNFALNNGLIEESTTILTTSPALIDCKNDFPDLNIQNISSSWKRDKLHKYQRTIKDFSCKIYDACKDDDILSEYALVLAREAVNASRLIYKAGLLKNDDIVSPRVMISVDTGSDHRLSRLNPPYDILLKKNNNFSCIYVPFEAPEGYGLRLPSIFDRLARAGIGSVVYRIGVLASAFFRFLKKDVSIFILRENELLIETASEFIKKGYVVSKLKPYSSVSNNNLYLKYEINNRLYKLIRSRVSDWVCNSVVESCSKEIVNSMANSVYRQVDSTAYWSGCSLIKKKNTVVLTGHPGRPEDISLFNVLNKYGNKMYTFQHGVTPELSLVLDEESPFCESSCSNTFFSFNYKIKDYYDSLPYTKGLINPVGMPKRFYNKIISKNCSNDFLYVSMNLYRGNINFLSGFMTDYDRFLFEKNIVINVLSKIKRNVVYKPYPETNIRYTDSDPALKYVDQYGISIEKSYVDLRYIVNKYKAIIVSGASSTISWIIMSDVPLIFINNNNKLTLRDEFKNDLVDSVIYFDIDDKDSFQNIKSYLNKPINEIVLDWHNKKHNRDKLINKWFSCGNTSPGKMASSHILSRIEIDEKM